MNSVDGLKRKNVEKKKNKKTETNQGGVEILVDFAWLS